MIANMIMMSEISLLDDARSVKKEMKKAERREKGKRRTRIILDTALMALTPGNVIMKEYKEYPLR